MYDYIVIGAGSAGCVLTRRLLERGATVLLLEAGTPDQNPDIHQPSGWPALWNGENDWAYPTVPQPHTANRVHVWPRGKVLGGSSALNAMIYVRGHRHDYDHWAYQGNPGWDYQSLLPLFRRSEDWELGADDYHGVGGPLHVSLNRNPNPTALAFVEAGLELGLPHNPDPNGPQQEGIGLCPLTIKSGQRQSAAVAFLRPVLGHPGLSVKTGAEVVRLRIHQKRCYGVEFVRDGQPQRAECSQEVLICAGTIASPALLLRSGIGPAEELRVLGIGVVADLPGVGQNLHDHLLSVLVFESRQPVPPGRANLLEAQLFTRSRPGLLTPDLQPVFMHFATSPFGKTPPPHGYTLAPGIIRPHSRGYLRLRSADPAVPPEINPRYLAEEADLEALVAAFELCRELAAARAFEPWRGQEVWPGPEVRSRADLRRYIAQTAQTYHHQVGTCRMGVDALAVVDPLLRVRGVEGLRVADASIMPTVPGGNTNAPSILIGEKAADLICAQE